MDGTLKSTSINQRKSVKVKEKEKKRGQCTSRNGSMGPEFMCGRPSPISPFQSIFCVREWKSASSISSGAGLKRTEPVHLIDSRYRIDLLLCWISQSAVRSLPVQLSHECFTHSLTLSLHTRTHIHTSHTHLCSWLSTPLLPSTIGFYHIRYGSLHRL